MPHAEVLLLERSGRVGGALCTEHVDGYLVECGPDSFLSRKPRGVGLCEELGLRDELIGRRPENARSFVRLGDRAAPAARGSDRARAHRPRRARTEHAAVAGGKAAPRGRGGASAGAVRRGRVDRVLRHSPPRPGGLRAPRRAAHDRDLRRGRRTAVAAGDVPAAPCARARAREPPPRPPCPSTSPEPAPTLRQPALGHRDAGPSRRGRPQADERPRGRRCALGANRLRRRARRRRARAGGRRRPGHPCVRRRGARFRARPRARRRPRGDSVCRERDRDARLPRGRRGASARRLRLRRAAQRGVDCPRMHLELEQVGRSRAGRPRPAAGLRRFRRPRRTRTSSHWRETRSRCSGSAPSPC